MTDGQHQKPFHQMGLVKKMNEHDHRLSVAQVVSAPGDGNLSVSGITGPERRAANLAPLWAEQGIDVTVLYQLDRSVQKPAHADGV